MLGGVRSDGAATSLGEPAFAETTTVVFGIAAPDAGLLVGLQRVLQAIFTNHACVADGHGGFDLLHGGPCRPDGEEERWL